MFSAALLIRLRSEVKSGVISRLRVRSPAPAKTSGRWFGNKESLSSQWLQRRRWKSDHLRSAWCIQWLSLHHQTGLFCVLQEGGREKSFRYWPRLGSRHNTVTYGRFKITTRFRTDSGCYATTGLKIKHLLTGQERTVWHLQYTDWPDHGCPEDFKGFLCKYNTDISRSLCQTLLPSALQILLQKK